VKERIERNRAEYLRKHKLSEDKLRTLEQRKKDRQAKVLNPMDWLDPVAKKKYSYDCVAGKHNMKGLTCILTWQRFLDSPETKASIAAAMREDEEDEERQRQEEEQDYESDPDLGVYNRGEMDRMNAEQDLIAKAFAEIGGMQVSHSWVVAQMLDPLLREERIEKNREEHLRKEKLSTSSSDADDEDIDNRVIDGGQQRCVGAKTEEVMTTRGLAKTEEGTTRVGAKTENVTTTMATTTTDQTSVRNPQCKEGFLGKKSQATYPRSRTELESGQVDTQGSQKFRRRKRDNEPVTAVVKGGPVERERDVAEQAEQDLIEKAFAEIGGRKISFPYEMLRAPAMRPPIDQNSMGETHSHLGKVEEESRDDTKKATYYLGGYERFGRSLTKERKY
jgi:hypothetical protein